MYNIMYIAFIEYIDLNKYIKMEALGRPLKFRLGKERVKCPKGEASEMPRHTHRVEQDGTQLLRQDFQRPLASKGSRFV